MFNLRLGRTGRRRLIVGGLAAIGLAMLLLPPSLTRTIRLYAGPVFHPLRDLTEGAMLDLREHARGEPWHSPAEEEWVGLRRQNEALEGSLVKATAMLYRYERCVEDLAGIRRGLEGLPCRLIPASVLPVHVPGKRAVLRLAEGTERGIRRGHTVLSRHIDRGAREAIERGQPVLAAAGLVGIVEAVGPHMSTVRLVSDPESRIMVQVITRRAGKWRAGPTAVAVGDAEGAAIRLRGITRTAEVAVGDYVVTSPSAESPVPPYLIVGRVARSELRPAAVFFDVTVEPRVSPADVDLVYVLAPPVGDTTP